jgi:hypothetical protein
MQKKISHGSHNPRSYFLIYSKKVRRSKNLHQSPSWASEEQGTCEKHMGNQKGKLQSSKNSSWSTPSSNSS